MKEIVQVKLENEMDLILAHRRTMKLCELTGFSLIIQTSIATAVSEISRCAIDHGKDAVLVLGIDVLAGKKYFKALVRDQSDFTIRCTEACSYAKRLVELEITRSAKEIQIILKQQISFAGTLSEAKVETFVDYFRKEPPLSPYDELRRRNLLLQDFAEKIRESESDYRNLTDSLPLMIFTVSNRGVINFSNKWLQSFLGTIPKELSSPSWKNHLHPDDAQMFVRDLSAALQKQAHLNRNYRFKEKSTGKYLWHLFSIIPQKNENEVIQRWIGFIVDIDANVQVEQTLKDNQRLKDMQKRLFENQEELQKKIVELNRSNYELEQFAHLASHDLQEPLRKLFFYSDVLKKKYSQSIDEAGVTMLNNMAQAAGRMKELINDLLSYSQLQQQKLIFENVNLNEIMDDILREMDLVIREKNAVVEISNLPNITGNNLRLRQLFSNLISNALKYSKKEIAPEIKVMGKPLEDSVAITVYDNGIGFEEEYREKIFGLFERLHTRDKFPGTGIGLSICRRIAELHRGTISATSVPNEYAIFEVTLPLNQEVTVPNNSLGNE